MGKPIECTDAVSRKDVINAIDKWITEYKPQHYLIQSIRELPSVTQKSGKWIIRDDLSTVRYYQCSECNEIDLDISDYCPNCGARMESEDNTRPHYANEWSPEDSLYVEQGILYDK